MDITVEVYAERVSTGERRHTQPRHVVFVAIDEDGKPKRVPRLVPETEEERAALRARGSASAEPATDVTASGGGAGVERGRRQDGRAPRRRAGRCRRPASCPPAFVATSMGAVIAAGLAAGVGHEELLARLTEAGPRGIAREPLALVSGLFADRCSGRRRSAAPIEALVPARRFAELRVPLTVSVVDLDTGELLLFGAGGRDAPLVDVLCASCALPLYLPAGRCWTAGAAATAGSAACSRSRRRRAMVT